MPNHRLERRTLRIVVTTSTTGITYKSDTRMATQKAPITYEVVSTPPTTKKQKATFIELVAAPDHIINSLRGSRVARGGDRRVHGVRSPACARGS